MTKRQSSFNWFRIIGVSLILALLFISSRTDHLVAYFGRRFEPIDEAFTTAIPTPVWPVDLASYHSQNMMVYDLTNQQILLNKLADNDVPMASLTKIMTVILAIENLDNYETKTATIGPEIMTEMWHQNASLAGFRAGEKVSYLDLMYGAMLPSGGEATLALAQAVSGSTDAFVRLMNQKSQALNMTKTVFKNPTGLDADGQVASARDLIRLLRYALKNPTFHQIFTTREYRSANGLLLKNTVLNVISADEQVGFRISGGKSGTTGAAGLCWAVLAEKNGREFLIIALGAPLDDLNRPTPYQKIDTLEILKTIE